MKRIIVAFLLILNIGIAYGASDKTITSKTYVDNQLATKQDKIRAIDDKTVITHTGSAGEIGEKGIYDSTGNYAEQQTSLVTAGDANTGINNALENEFVCVEFDTDSTCLLWKVKNEFTPSKNLFDSRQLLQASGWTENNGVYTGRAQPMFYATHNGNVFSSGLFEPNTQYTLSYTMSADSNSNVVRARMYFNYSDGTWDIDSNLWVQGGQTKHVVWTSPAGKTVESVSFTYGEYNAQISISNVQVEKGTVATPYQPYGNTYLPQNQ